MTRANIDADIFTYSFGSCKDPYGNPLAWPLVATRLNAQIKTICTAVRASNHQLYLTEGPSNFRFKVAEIQPYKGTRPSEKPYWYQTVRDYLVKFRNAIIIEGWEADDQLSIDQTDDTVLCSLDKDLDMVVGRHYNWVKDKEYVVTQTDALQSFYCQLLTGDRVDAILGLHGIGGSSACVKRVRTMASELDMLYEVRTAYEQRYGRYGWEFLKENAALLWMLTKEPKCKERPEQEVYERLEALRVGLTGLSWKKELQKHLTSIK